MQQKKQKDVKFWIINKLKLSDSDIENEIQTIRTDNSGKSKIQLPFDEHQVGKCHHK